MYKCKNVNEIECQTHCQAQVFVKTKKNKETREARPGINDLHGICLLENHSSELDIKAALCP